MEPEPASVVGPQPEREAESSVGVELVAQLHPQWPELLRARVEPRVFPGRPARELEQVLALEFANLPSAWVDSGFERAWVVE